MEEHGFYWFKLIPGFEFRYMHVYGAALVLVLLVVLGIQSGRRFSRGSLVPDKRFTLATPFEIICEMLSRLQQGIIGPHADRYLPLTGSVFLFILGCNLIGMVPGFKAPTENFYTNLACALVVVVATHIYGVKHHGMKGYGKHFLAPLAGLGGVLLSLLFTPIELISHAFRLVSLPLRLWGNISADHTVLHIMEGFLPVLLPIPFLFLGLLVAVVQAFIFALLAMIYIALATAEEH